MKRIPKTPIEFDYDLWTTEDGKCMVRVKRTGEVSEVDREVMKILRADEKKLRRALPTKETDDTDEESTPMVMSYDALPDDDVKESAWLADPSNLEDEVLTELFIEEFCNELPAMQAAFFRECLLAGKEQQLFAAENSVERTTLWRWQKQIKEKIKKYF